MDNVSQYAPKVLSSARSHRLASRMRCRIFAASFFTTGSDMVNALLISSRLNCASKLRSDSSGLPLRCFDAAAKPHFPPAGSVFVRCSFGLAAPRPSTEAAPSVGPAGGCGCCGSFAGTLPRSAMGWEDLLPDSLRVLDREQLRLEPERPAPPRVKSLRGGGSGEHRPSLVIVFWAGKHGERHRTDPCGIVFESSGSEPKRRNKVKLYKRAGYTHTRQDSTLYKIWLSRSHLASS